MNAIEGEERIPNGTRVKVPNVPRSSGTVVSYHESGDYTVQLDNYGPVLFERCSIECLHPINDPTKPEAYVKNA